MLLFALMALAFAACKKEKAAPDPGPLAPGNWQSYAYWQPNTEAWLAIPDSLGIASSITFRNNGTFEQTSAAGVKTTVKWNRVTDKPDDVPADAHLLEILPDEVVPDGHKLRSFLLITFNSANEITIAPYHLPADRPYINTITAVRYKRH